MDSLKIAAIITGGIAITLIILGLVSPYIIINDHIYIIGPSPKAKLQGFNYTIETFETPPIPANTTIDVIATKSPNGNLTIQIANNSPDIKGLPESFLFSLKGGDTTFNYQLLIYQPGRYVVIVTSYNATYSLYISGRWASFYQLNELVIWGLIVMLIFIAITYYRSILLARQRMYRLALEGVNKNGKRIRDHGEIAKELTNWYAILHRGRASSLRL